VSGSTGTSTNWKRREKKGVKGNLLRRCPGEVLSQTLISGGIVGELGENLSNMNKHGGFRKENAEPGEEG